MRTLTLLFALATGSALFSQPLCNAMQAGFSHSPTPLGIQFTDQTVGNQPTSWSWDFGDGTTSTQQNPLHAYTQPGTYRVCLTAWYRPSQTSRDSCRSTRCESITFHRPNTNTCAWLHANFTSTRTSAGIQFNYTPPDPNAQYRYQWDFGDGNTSTDQNPLHVYANDGRYQVCLVVTARTATGTTVYCTRRSCQLVPWHSPRPDPCVWLDAGFTFTRATTGIQFNYAPTDPNAQYRYRWDFGDGTTSTDQNPLHRYAADGQYRVCLVVTGISTAGTNTACTARSCEEVGWPRMAPWPDERSFTLYPQPALDHLMIAGPEDAPTGAVLRLFGLDGQVLRQERVDAWPHRLVLEGLAPGTFLLRLEGEGQALHWRVMVMR